MSDLNITTTLAFPGEKQMIQQQMKAERWNARYVRTDEGVVVFQELVHETDINVTLNGKQSTSPRWLLSLQWHPTRKLQHLPLPVILIICSIVHLLSSGYFDEPAPNIHVALEDGNVHKRALSFAELLKIQHIFVIHFNRKPITDIWTSFKILSAHSKILMNWTDGSSVSAARCH